MRTFFIIFFGQIVSLLGSRMTNFALGVWVYDQTGRATPFVLTALFGALPVVLLSPVAGALVDRWNRRMVLIFSDLGAALATLAAFILFSTGRLEVWHIYLIAAVSGSFGAFQEPAFGASVTMMVPKKQFARVSGIQQTGQAVAGILSPVLAGVLFGLINVNGIILVDFVTFFFAVGTLLFVYIPQPERTTEGQDENPSIWRDIRFGWRYLSERHGLMGMVIYIALANFTINSVTSLTAPMVLSFADAQVLGAVQTTASAGFFVGGLIISTWGGPKRKVNGMYMGAFLSSLGLTLVGIIPAAWWIGGALFIFLAPIPMVNSSIRAIMQSKVPADIQGRVFAMMTMIARSGQPLGYLISGPLADKVFEPLMMAGGPLAGSFGTVMGVGQGRGIGLMFLVAGLGMLLVTVLMYAYPRLRFVEDELPDMVPDTLPEMGD